MPTAFLRRTYGGVTPLDEASEQIFAKWRPGEVIRITVSKPRNYRLHAKAFVLLDKVFPHTSYPTKDMLRKAMTIAAGYVEPVQTVTGEIVMCPRSWKFSEMDETEFQELYDRLVDVSLALIPGSSRSDWHLAVEDVVRM